MTIKTISSAKPRLLDQVRGKIRLKHYSICTEQEYTDWIRRFILPHGKRLPREKAGHQCASGQPAQDSGEMTFSPIGRPYLIL